MMNPKAANLPPAPQAMQDALMDVVDELVACLSTVALYYERRGLKEGLFTKEELEAGDGEK